MIDVDALIVDCQAAVAESQPMLAVKEVVDRALRDPEALADALDAKRGVTILYRTSELTIASVVIPSGLGRGVAHDHRMWAVVGVYGGQEDNRFFRRAKSGLADSGGRSLRVSDVLAMGDDTIHAIENPLDRRDLAALHVYGGDLVGTERSMWTAPDHIEEPYDENTVVGKGGFRNKGDL